MSTSRRPFEGSDDSSWTAFQQSYVIRGAGVFWQYMAPSMIAPKGPMEPSNAPVLMASPAAIAPVTAPFATPPATPLTTPAVMEEP